MGQFVKVKSATRDVDECALETHYCHYEATCNNTIGSYTCVCNEGFSGNGTICEANRCPSASWTSYGSNCYRLNSNALTMQGASDYCDSIAGQLVRLTGEDLKNFLVQTYAKDIKTRFWIGLQKCKNGWCYLDGKKTIYTNWERGEPNNAGGSETCVEMFRNGRWNDNPCYHKYPSICETNINECHYRCHHNATCNKTIGSYTCVCNEGFTGNGTVCEDVDECALETHTCDLDATCNNTIGSYTCTCKDGFTGNGTSCKASLAAGHITLIGNLRTGKLLVISRVVFTLGIFRFTFELRSSKAESIKRSKC
ncbi:fibrillin-1-like [Dendronephthya gigantea]|uniref:fibrillin-1-like n=1 Tax=Dendronephthya gigantea TaxID=151771 RepID=UPI00106A9D04|nr:fibrillin-1-like [Dendronephthya gigantea]